MHPHGIVKDDQGAADQRGDESRGHCPPQLGHGGDQGGVGGVPCSPQRSRSQREDEEARSPLTPRAEDEGGRAQSGVRAECDERKPSEDDPGERQHSGPRVDEGGTVSRIRVPGGAGALCEVGERRTEESEVHGPRPGDVRPLVGGEASTESVIARDGSRDLRLLGGSSLDENPVPGEFGGEFVGSGGRCESQQGRSVQARQEIQPRGESARAEEHGLADRRGDPGGDQSFGDQVSSAQGQGQDERLVLEVGNESSKTKRPGGCCGVSELQESITEQEFVLAYGNQHPTYLVHDSAEGEAVDGFLGESAAKRAYERGDFSFETCQLLLEQAGLGVTKLHRGEVLAAGADGNVEGGLSNPNKSKGSSGVYKTFGLFTHGGVQGITTATQTSSHLTRYLNCFGRHHLPEGSTWTSFTVSFDVQSRVHHDSNNLGGSLNHSLSLGQVSGGGLWIEKKGVTEAETEEGNLVWKRTGGGEWLPGHVHENYKKFLSFDPHLKHATQAWEGSRWGLIFHTTRSILRVGDELRKGLRKVGFPLPNKKFLTGSTGQNASYKHKGKPSKVQRNALMRSAAQLSVLFTMLLSAATSYLCEGHARDPIPDPIVLFEIGGFDASLEATELSKSIVEPMSWQDFVDPEKAETAYHFVKGATPRELRLHLEELPGRAKQAAHTLVEAQLEEGGTVVLQGGDPEGLAKDFSDFVQHQNKDGTGGPHVVLYRPKEGHSTLPGGARPHSVCVSDLVPPVGRPAIPNVDHKGSGITFDSSVSSAAQGALRRLHQNLGHPRKEDLLRHLRLAGCDAGILKAVKGMRCEVCESTQGPKVARPSTLPHLYNFNDCVGGDILYVHDVNDKKHTFLNIVDWGTTYQVVVRLPGTKAEHLEKAFNDSWLVPFGPPKSVSLDLEGGLQKGISRLCDWHNIRVQHVAAQAHWQAGITERHGAWWKNIWERVVHERSVDEGEVEVAATCVSAAKNELRRRCGHSPVSWVFGREPRGPEELVDPDCGQRIPWETSDDSKFQRLTALRTSARVAFHHSQNDDRLRRALLQRARTTSRPYSVGEPVHFWYKPKDRRRGRWAGPGVIVGQEGGNFWVSRNGRCRLTAPEHLRPSGPEEVGELLAMKQTREQVDKLLQADLDDDEAYDTDGMVSGGEQEEDLLVDYEPSLPGDPDVEMPLGDEGFGLDLGIGEEIAAPRRRLKRKTRPDELEGPDEEHRSPDVHSAMHLKRDLTQRGKEKRQEKELRWAEIPEHVREMFKAAERTLSGKNTSTSTPCSPCQSRIQTGFERQ